MRSASFGQRWIVGEVTPWLRALTARPVCSLQQISDVALNAARAQGYDTARYTTLGIAVPQIDCFWTGAYFPPGIWMNGQVNRHLIAHELGHTYGVVEEGHHRRAPRQFPARRDRPPVERSVRLARHRQRRRDWLEYRPPAPLWAYGSPEATTGLVVYGGSNGLGDGGRFPGRNYVIADPVQRGRPSAQAGETFAVPDTFAVEVTSATMDGAEVRFRWTDRIRPAAPRLLRPLRRGRRLVVRWRRGVERGSGIAAHEVFLDGRHLARIPAARSSAGFLVRNDDRVTLRAPRGRRRLTVVAIDRAGNRSRPALLTLRPSRAASRRGIRVRSGSMTFAVRAFDPNGDRPGLERLWSATQESVWPAEPDVLDVIRDGLVAEQQGQIVGLVAVDAGSITLLVVAPSAQRAGVGSALHSAALELLRGRGSERATLGSGGHDYLWPGLPAN
jgi:ribosomal protein S18 acetylase RimI-like enzyme